MRLMVNPKSVSTTCNGPSPVARSSRLAGLTSRWMSSASCTACSPESTWSRTVATVLSASGPKSPISVCSEPPDIRSLAISTVPSSATQLYGLTMCGWSSRTDCSRTKRSRSPASRWRSSFAAQ